MLYCGCTLLGNATHVANVLMCNTLFASTCASSYGHSTFSCFATAACCREDMHASIHQQHRFAVFHAAQILWHLLDIIPSLARIVGDSHRPCWALQQQQQAHEAWHCQQHSLYQACVGK